MSLEQLVAVALIATMAGLWARRGTWTFRWESAATINLAGLAIYFVCVMPATAPAYDVLYHLTGVWNLEDLVGHTAYLFGIGTLAHAMIARLDIADRRRFLRQRFELPVNIGLPTLIGVFVAASPDHHAADLLFEPARGWLAVYWILWAALSLWILGHLLWAMLIIRTDRRSAPVANIYVAAVAVDIASLVALCLSVTVGLPASVAAVLICVATVCYAAAAIYGMRGVKRRLTLLPPKQAEPAEPRPAEPEASA